MKMQPHHTQKICRSIVALQVMADKADAKDAEVMRDAAFYLMELSVKHAYPEAQSLIEVLP